MISINLGVMNLLPIPALDGGRIIFILIEMISRRRLPKKLEDTINMVGLMVLFGLSIIIMIKDFISLVF
jgi:regulator of sigma E protease